MAISINGIEFTLIEMLVWLLVGAIVGAIGSALVGYSPGGLIGSIAVGLIGALFGTWLARQLGLPALLTFEFNGTRMELLWAILGAALLVLILSLIRGGPRYRRRRYSS